MISILKDKSLYKQQALIGGRFFGGQCISVVNPASGNTIAMVPDCGVSEAISAVKSAAKAWKPWARETAKDRSVILRRWFDLVVSNRDDLATILTSEQGKPLAEALAEVDYAASYIEFYAEEAKRLSGEILQSHRRDGRIHLIRQPIGVVAAITPWNFPAAMVTRKVAPALAAGCSVVLKPAPETPLVALALAELATRAGLPPGLLNVITGDAATIGSVLTTHPAVRMISFTGSTPVGKLLLRQGSETVKKVALELGGNAPFIVFQDADIEAAVEGAMISKYRNMGQTCVCTNRFYVHSAVHDEFVDALAQKVSDLKVGDGLLEGINQGPLISGAAVSKVESHIADAISKGATVVIGGQRHSLGGTFFEPTILTGMTAEMRMAEEETFGPVSTIFEFNDEKDVIAAANSSVSGLAAYFYTRDVSRVFRMMEALEYGMVGVNSGLISTELAPFGGIKESGNSREGSRHGLEEFTELKYVYLGIE